MIKKITLTIILLFNLIFNVKAEKVNFFNEAKNLFENEKYKDSKLFPLSGYSNSEIILCNEYGYFNHIFTDRYGFNNPDNLLISSSSNPNTTSCPFSVK